MPLRAHDAAGVAYATPGSHGDANPLANKGRYMPSLAEMGLFDRSHVYTQADVEVVLPPERLFAPSE